MKYLKITGLILAVLLLGAIIFLVYTPGRQRDIYIGPEFAYDGFNNVKYGRYDKIREYIPMKDGTKLAITTFLPKGSHEQKYPVILTYSPYSNSYVVLGMTWKDRIVSKYNSGKWGPVYESVVPPRLDTYISNGYAIAMVDLRGTGSSTGYAGIHDPKYTEDAGEMLAWIANQPWSNKKIGMMGFSYVGWSQFAAARSKSPYLKCIVPEATYFNIYEEAVRPGGIRADKWLSGYSPYLQAYTRNLWVPQDGIFPSEPVIDEDGDGKLYDEIPIIRKDDDQPYSGILQYADGHERKENPYVTMTKEHEKDITTMEVQNQIKYIDDSLVYYGNKLSLSDLSIDRMIHTLKETKIPVLLIGRFFDGWSRGAVYSFASLQNTNPTYLIMTPGFHGGLNYNYWKWFNVDGYTNDMELSMQLQFFDKYLKGMENGLDTKPPVRIYTAFDGWKYYETWPPTEATSVKYSFGLNNKLTREVQADSVYAYNVDFTHSSSYNDKGYNPLLMYTAMGDDDPLMTRNELDKKCLVFETDVLNESVTITGSPIISLNVSSNQVNGDLFVYLSDVDSSGVVYYMSEGKLRAGWHNLFDNDEMVDGLYDVKPELPWHSYKRKNYDPTPFANGSIINLKFEIKPQAWKIRAGHKIRLSIAGADYQYSQFNPAISPDNTLESCKPTTLSIHTGKTSNSYLELPVVQ